MVIKNHIRKDNSVSMYNSESIGHETGKGVLRGKEIMSGIGNAMENVMRSQKE